MAAASCTQIRDVKLKVESSDDAFRLGTTGVIAEEVQLEALLLAASDEPFSVRVLFGCEMSRLSGLSFELPHWSR